MASIRHDPDAPLLERRPPDPISPLGVGLRLAALLPRAELVVIPAVDHMFARDHADLVAPHVERHLAAE